VKIERIDREIAKTEEKISEYQARLRELKNQKTEAENLEIVALVRGVGIPHTELAAAVALLRQNREIPAYAPPARRGPDPAPEPEPDRED
jgi:type II secretory pathway component HofQ